jgi:hypothetical protein
MQANPEFRSLDKAFWSHVRTISEIGGYTRQAQVRAYSPDEIIKVLSQAGFRPDPLVSYGAESDSLLPRLAAYFAYRASILNDVVRTYLMTAEQAAEVFHEHYDRLRPARLSPMNKQTGLKKQPAYLTGLVNMLIEAHLGDLPCNYDPRQLTTITRDGQPLRTLARRVDGCFPAVINPIALWEIKEYYYTTTFGSRIADGVYETLLDGLELEELREHEGIHIDHILIIDAYQTWWKMGKSYLCRIIDMLNMGYVDEVLFGYEVVQRLPAIVENWKRVYHQQL